MTEGVPHLADALGFVVHPPVRERPPAPALGFDEAVVDATARILAAGHRRFADGMAMFDDEKRRQREVRAAYDEGMSDGSMGFADKAMRDEAWRHSDARKGLRSSGGRVILGRVVLCRDPRAKGRESWAIIGADGDRAWLRNGDIRLEVALADCRDVVDLEPVS